MRKTRIYILILIVCIFTLTFSGCTLKDISLQVYAGKEYEAYADRDIKIFCTGEEIKDYFSDNEMFCPSADFNSILDEMIQTNFFDKKAILFLTLSGVGSDTTVKVQRNTSISTTTLTFIISPGMCEDITAKFFFFEIPQELDKEYKYNFDVSYK